MIDTNQLENTRTQMKKGILEYCILSIIGEDELYSSDIIEKLKAAELIIVEGTIYPLLSRLKNIGLLEYSWKESNAGPPRKYFKLTANGHQFLQELDNTWIEIKQAVEKLTNPTKK